MWFSAWFKRAVLYTKLGFKDLVLGYNTELSLCLAIVYELLCKTVTPKENQKVTELSTLLFFFFFLRWYGGEQKAQTLVSKTVSDLASSSLYFSVLWESYLTLFESHLFIHNMEIIIPTANLMWKIKFILQ